MSADDSAVMSTIGPSGYSLDQLLQWCESDQLIDGFTISDDRVVIFHEGERRSFSPGDAHTFLKGVFTATQRNRDLDEANRA